LEIDWLTVAAQIVNFLVLVWLLQRFLYRPITNAMRRREERIEGRLAEAKQTREEAEQEARRVQEREEELEARRDEILASAREEAGELRERLEAEIREEMQEKRDAWARHLAEERAALVASMRRQAGRHVLRVTERILQDYADTDLSERVVASFARRIAELDDETRGTLAEAARRREEAALVQTGAAVDTAAKARITRAIHEALSTDIDVDYHEDHEMILGVRLTIGDHTVEWSAMRYLDRLEAEFDEILESGSRAMGPAGERGPA
jgi:F-type H+-transporting ATPase subunit b